MFCPECGSEEREANQFCRKCGIDLRRVRVAVAEPDSVTASAVSARDEIGRAIASKIREYQSPNDLAVVAEEVLPEIEKFLESPEEKRLRRMRAGMITSGVGLGAAIGFAAAATAMGDAGILLLAGAGVVCVFIGMAIMLNGIYFSGTRKKQMEKGMPASEPRADELEMPVANLFASVTENTTRHLDGK